MRKRWWFVAVLVGMLAVGATGGAILAQESGGTNGDSPLKSFAARVAAILGIEEAQVQDAFKQAARELQDERIQRRLDRLVESGRLTQEQADQYIEWYQSRPDAISGGAPLPGLQGRGLHRRGPRFGHGRHGFGSLKPVPTPTPQTLDATSL